MSVFGSPYDFFIFCHKTGQILSKPNDHWSIWSRKFIGPRLVSAVRFSSSLGTRANVSRIYELTVCGHRRTNTSRWPQWVVDMLIQHSRSFRPAATQRERKVMSRSCSIRFATNNFVRIVNIRLYYPDNIWVSWFWVIHSNLNCPNSKYMTIELSS